MLLISSIICKQVSAKFLCFKAYFSGFMIYLTSLFTPWFLRRGGRKTCWLVCKLQYNVNINGNNYYLKGFPLSGAPLIKRIRYLFSTMGTMSIKVKRYLATLFFPCLLPRSCSPYEIKFTSMKKACSQRGSSYT